MAIAGSILALMKWLESIPTMLLLVAAIFVGLAPFTPEPHIIEKIRLLGEGRLTRPIDIFDLLFHLFPSILLIAKFSYRLKR